jgi:hypothetical protein
VAAQSAMHAIIVDVLELIRAASAIDAQAARKEA